LPGRELKDSRGQSGGSANYQSCRYNVASKHLKRMTKRERKKKTASKSFILALTFVEDKIKLIRKNGRNKLWNLLFASIIYYQNVMIIGSEKIKNSFILLLLIL
jgi:hypothetical protein